MCTPGTNRENRLLVGKGADIGIDLLARIGLDNGIQQRLHAGDDVRWDVSNCHFVLLQTFEVRFDERVRMIRMSMRWCW